MSKFYENIKGKEEARAKNSLRREKMATYLYDLSKLSFGGVVIGAAFAWASDMSNTVFVYAMLIGLLATIELAVVANKLLK